jgi:diadenosine tetraphosphate (Ap4A) HIT family hydrolase
MSSPFLQIDNSQWLFSNDLAFAIKDQFPISPGHSLIIPKREIATWFDATREEHIAIIDIIRDLKNLLDTEYNPTGYNIGINSGIDAGQTVMHLHVHVIPRFKNDVKDPRGGIRNIILDKAIYW